METLTLDYKFHFLPELRLIVNAGIDKQKVMAKQKLVLFKEQVTGMVYQVILLKTKL